MITRRGPGWQLILADLSLILFLVTLSTLAGVADQDVHGTVAEREKAPEFAASQALFRPDPLGPTLGEWLDDQSPDARATLTVFARHTEDDKEAIWEIAQALASDASGRGFAVRVVISQDQTILSEESQSAGASDVYASLAYDEAVNAPEVADNAE